MAYAEINAETGRIDVQSEYRERELTKQLPGGKYIPERKVWDVSLAWSSCIQLRGIFGSDLQIGPALNEWARQQRDNRVNPCLELRVAEDSVDPDMDARLRPFQRAGVEFLSTARQALLADEMGLGKTVQTIAALEEIGDEAYPVLIVAPNSMRQTWGKEFAKWAPSRRVVVFQASGLRDTSKSLRGKAYTKAQEIAHVRDGHADVLVINWEALSGFSRQTGYGKITLTDEQKREKELNEVDFHTIVADEAHKAKDPKAQQTRSLWYLGSTVENRIMLTGTPVANSPEDIWSLMHFVSPEDFPAKTKFIDRYALTSYNSWSGGVDVLGIKSETREELFKILDPRFIRRTKAAVLPQLPAKQYSVREVELGTKQRKAYDQMESQMLADLDGGLLMATNPLTQMLRLMQFACACGEVDAEDNLVLTDPSATVDAVEEIAAEMGTSKAVFFSESVQLINIAATRLRESGYKIGLVTGTVTGQARQDNIDGFNTGQIQFLLVTLGAGGEGLSLTGASTEVFLQRSFSAIKNSQGEDRLHGIGRGEEGKALNIIDIVAQNTIQAHVFQVMAEKAEKLEEIARDKETLRTWLTK